jgi:hypothetical protein
VNGATQGMSLNLSRTERLRVILTYSTLLAGGVGIVTEFNWLGLAGIFICALSNASFLALLFRVGGARALVGGFVLHFYYYIYSSVSSRRSLHRPRAYPVYDATYQAAVETIKVWMITLENFQTVGRNGMHRDNNHTTRC